MYKEMMEVCEIRDQSDSEYQIKKKKEQHLDHLHVLDLCTAGEAGQTLNQVTGQITADRQTVCVKPIKNSDEQPAQ